MKNPQFRLERLSEQDLRDIIHNCSRLAKKTLIPPACMSRCADLLLACADDPSPKPRGPAGHPAPDFIDEYLAHVGAYLGLIFDVQTAKTGAVYPKAEEARRKGLCGPVPRLSEPLQTDAPQAPGPRAEDLDPRDKAEAPKTPKQPRRLQSSTKKRMRRTHRTPLAAMPMFETLLQKMGEKSPGPGSPGLAAQPTGAADGRERRKKSKSPRAAGCITALFGALLLQREAEVRIDDLQAKPSLAETGFDPAELEHLGETTIRPITADRSLLSHDRLEEDFALLQGLEADPPRRPAPKKPYTVLESPIEEEEPDLPFPEQSRGSQRFVDLARFESAAPTPRPAELASKLEDPPRYLLSWRGHAQLAKSSRDRLQREPLLHGSERPRAETFRKNTPQLGQLSDAAPASSKRASHKHNFSLKVDIGNIYINTVPGPASKPFPLSRCVAQTRHRSSVSPELDPPASACTQLPLPRNSLRDRRLASGFSGTATEPRQESAERKAKPQPAPLVPRLHIQQASQKRVKSKTPQLLDSHLRGREPQQDSATLGSQREASREPRSPLLPSSARAPQEPALGERSALRRSRLGTSTASGHAKKQQLLDKIKNKFRLEIHPKTDRLGVPLKAEDRDATFGLGRARPEQLIRSSVRLSEKADLLRAAPQRPEAASTLPGAASRTSAKHQSVNLTNSLRLDVSEYRNKKPPLTNS